VRLKALIVPILLALFACNSEKDAKSGSIDPAAKVEISFNKTKWGVKEGLDYPHRDQMLNSVVCNDTIRALNKDEITNLLGEPDRSNEGYLYYTISQKRLGSWPLHTKTMVIKIMGDGTIEWIKIHK